MKKFRLGLQALELRELRHATDC